jgi:undecaprenyl phosphate-alpha-L-ara4FN deformylase
MKRIALKIDADTLHGTRTGVPALVELLQRHEAQASFFFSLGRDSSGTQARKDSLKAYYKLSTRLYGRLFPAPDIGSRCADIMRQTSEAGFEVGLHGMNRVKWESTIQQAENAWVEEEMESACARFSDIFANPPKAYAAAGWKMNRHALRLTQRLGFTYASDCRGSHPFIPVIDGEIVACPQVPTTLPTLDEVLAQEPGCSPDQAVDRILELAASRDGDQVFNLRAELEGMKFSAAFERLLTAWKSSDVQLVSLADIHTAFELKDLPRHAVEFREIPGRPGLRMVQGPVFLQGS